MARYLYSELAQLVQARLNCIKSGNQEWLDRHEDRIEALVREHMPSGYGFDHGTKLDLDLSHAEKLVFTTGFHHMNDGGFYDGWTEHVITLTPSFSGFHMRISGRDRNGIKEYIGDTFHQSLMELTELDTTPAVAQ